MIWFTADTHFAHSRIIEYCQRPFHTVEDMDWNLIHNWNSVVAPMDTVFILGDFAWKNPNIYAKQLNGYKNLILGSHDKRKQCEGHFTTIIDFGIDIKIDKQHVTLCHYRMGVWPRSHYGAYNLYGHSHNLSQPDRKELSMDVGVDCNKYAPVSWEAVKEFMKSKTVSA